MSETRRKFNRNFSEGGVGLVLETGQPIARVAPDLAINEGTLGNWVAKERAARGEGQGVLSEDQRAELERLRRVNAELQMQRDALKRTRLGIIQSMGRSRSGLDNAAIGSWHSTVTFELLGLEHFATNVQARDNVAAWINEYNRDRRHSALRMVSPIAVELARPFPPRQPAAVLTGVKAKPWGGLRQALTPAPDDSPPRPRGRSGRNADRARSA